MIEKKEIEYAKEIDDVMVLLIKIIEVIKEKGDYATILTELIAAVSGIDNVSEEFKANKIVAINTVINRAVDIAGIFLKEEEVAV